MIATSTLGVEAPHGHDVAADIDSGAAQPVVEMRFQLKYVLGGGLSALDEGQFRPIFFVKTIIQLC